MKEYDINTDYIKSVQRKKKIKTKAIAEALKVNVQQVYRIIKGSRNINIKKGKILADILEIPMDALVKEVEKKEKSDN
jgi:transcriptional regulator with XRE-family HTH domain